MAEPKIKLNPTILNDDLKKEFEDNHCDIDENYYEKKCNKFLLKKELAERNQLAQSDNDEDHLYPSLNDTLFNIKIAEKKEFNDTRYDGEIHDIKTQADILSKAEFELSPHQAFVRNFLSFQTPYNSLLLYHGLGSGKTCSAIGVCEEMRDYLKQMGISKRTIIVASPNVQDNFRLQLFDERKLKLVDGLWNIRACTGNKLLKEINPMNMKGIPKEKVISQIKNLINHSYLFLGYIEFANYIEKTASVKGQYKSEKDKLNAMKKNLQNEFNGRLIVIDEVHNIRIANDNENKKVAEQLLYLVKSADNMRLLLLSATPMYNSYKEIVWLLNLMNVNDRRGVIEINDIFDKDGYYKKNDEGEEIGKEMLIRKATGYVSFVRGDNPYTFPFRVYPILFSKKNTFHSTDITYPSFQMNGKKIGKDDILKIIDVYLTKIGEYQNLGYQYIIDSLRKKKITITTKQGVVKDMPTFDNMESFGYTLLQIPLEALNIIYPMEGLREAVEKIPPINLSIPEEEPEEPEELEPQQVVAQPTYAKKSAKKPSLKKYKGLKIVEDLEPVSVKGQVVELTRKPSSEPSVSSYEFEPVAKGGQPASVSENEIYINSNDLTGNKGLKRMMNFVDSKNPPEKGSFEYKSSTLQNFGKIFATDQIGKYSAKIKSICDNIVSESGVVSDGVIIIYSQYIDGGLIPIALALEEMGFTRFGQNANSLFKTPPTEPVDSRTFQPRKSRTESFMPARYVMITGDKRISPNNDYEVKAVTNDDNKDGNKIKVVLISKAGSEGVDFKFIRQVHVIEPWYNMNRTEQIIGRGVRNFSHKDLPFEKRNVQIFLHGTLLDKSKEEAADLYVYRAAEYKAVQIGRVSRVLKEVSVDCIINHDQGNFTQEIFSKELKTKVEQRLSTGLLIKDFKVGDAPYSSACDYMEDCQYKCYPGKSIDEIDVKENTYNETFIMMNSDKIIQKIKALFSDKIDGKFFYKKDDIIRRVNTPKPYPVIQIYAALTQLVEDTSEFITDKYGRTGYVVNIGDYYLFQPSELNNTKISLFDRSVPIDFKHNRIKIDVSKLEKPGVETPKKLVANEEVVPQEQVQLKEKPANVVDAKAIQEQENIITELKKQFDTAIETARTLQKVPRGDEDWYKHCGITMKKLIKEGILNQEDTLEFLVEHIVDVLMFDDKINLLNYIYSSKTFEEKSFEGLVKAYLDKKIIRSKNLTAIILFSLDKRKIVLLKGNKWVNAEPEDERDVAEAFSSKYKITADAFNNIVGFIGLENKNKYLVFKVKDMLAKRNTGARCDESKKTNKIEILNKIIGSEKYNKENTKGMVQAELCSLQEFLLRKYNKSKKDGKIWFLDFEMSMLYKF
jgi:superfamily II DNA or RNA helicase